MRQGRIDCDKYSYCASCEKTYDYTVTRCPDPHCRQKLRTEPRFKKIKWEYPRI